MPGRALLGVETEYAVTGIARNRMPWDRGRLVEAMFAAARKSCPHLRDGGSGLFLANGARLYLDRGNHPEFATPECSDPWEVVRYIKAGEALLLELAQEVKKQTPELAEVLVFRSNVDYDRQGTTWGCHESYLHRFRPRELPAQLIPHLVTRIIYAGAGGFNPTIPGVAFTLSPRAWLLPNVTSGDSTGERGIFHFREESLAGLGWERMHVICGESLGSETATVLKLGTTALVLAVVEAGRRPGDAVTLKDPVQAIRTIAADPDFRAGVSLQGGGQLSAREIQRHYLAEVQAGPGSRLPEWAGELCRLWRAQLDAIDAVAGSLERTLDWAIKQALYRRWVRHRMSWGTLQRASQLFEQLERVAARIFAEEGPVNITAALAGLAPFEDRLQRLEPLLRAANLTQADLQLFLRLRDELYEADARFGQLGPGGIFEQLDRAGVLSHRTGRRAPGLDARQGPPPGRARLRGAWIERLWRQGAASHYRSDWTGLRNEVTGRSLDLSDPFVTRAEWR